MGVLLWSAGAGERGRLAAFVDSCPGRSSRQNGTGCFPSRVVLEKAKCVQIYKNIFILINYKMKGGVQQPRGWRV